MLVTPLYIYSSLCMDKFICLLLPYIIMRLIKSVMRTGIISIDILIPGTQAILTITLSIYLSIYLYIFIYLSVSWSMEIREIQMTRPAQPYDYTCFCRLYSICIRNICLIYKYRVYNNLFWIFSYLNGLLQGIFVKTSFGTRVSRIGLGSFVNIDIFVLKYHFI